MRGKLLPVGAIACVWLACGTDYASSSGPQPDAGAEAAVTAEGERFGQCYPNGTCNVGLSCVDGLCVLVDAGTGKADADSGDASSQPGACAVTGGALQKPLPCGPATVCADGQICCLNAGSPSCSITGCDPSAPRFECGSAADCSEHLVCCVSAGESSLDDDGCPQPRTMKVSTCQATCSDPARKVCTSATDCPNGQSCVREDLQLFGDTYALGFCAPKN